MTTIIIFTTVTIGLFGFVIFAWSLIDTRKKYFNEYKKRKQK
jgi:hypothetical protein